MSKYREHHRALMAADPPLPLSPEELEAVRTLLGPLAQQVRQAA